LELKTIAPHFYVEKILREDDRLYIINFLNEHKTTNRVQGGTLIIENDSIEDARILTIFQSLITQFNDTVLINFSKHLPSKVNEIESRTSNKVSRYKTQIQGPFFSICEPNHYINAHRDDYYQFVICIIYLGHLDNTPSQTTSLLEGKEIIANYREEEITHYGNYENINRINFGYSNNSALFFLNNEYAYHMVDKPIEKDRATIMFSLEISVNEN
jgi:hypothetical protein